MKNLIYMILLSLLFAGCSTEEDVELPAETTTTIYELDENGNRKIDQENEDEIKDEKDEDN